MKSVKYSKFLGFNWDSLSLEDLLHKLSDYLLQSGFSTEFDDYGREQQNQTLQSLRDAILDALLNQGLLSDEQLAQLMAEPEEERNSKLSELVEKLVFLAKTKHHQDL